MAVSTCLRCTRDREIKSRGLCAVCYNWHRRHPEVPPPEKTRKTISEWYASVDRGQGCWIWTGPRHSEGYGIGAVDGKQHVSARRWVYEQEVGLIPPGKTVRAKTICTDRACVRPDHLEVLAEEPKALKKAVKPTPVPRPPLAEKDCEWCGAPFTPARRVSRTCSAECRKKHNNWEQRQKTRKPKVTADCVVCGDEFVKPRSDSTYCDKPECFKGAKRLRQSEGYVPKREQRPHRKCGWCGVEFSPIRSDAVRCSSRCNRLYRYSVDPKYGSRKAREWSLANPDRRRAISHNYSSKRRVWETESGRVEPKDWERTVRRYGGKCAYCGVGGPLHMDHVVPLSRGGSHTIGNVVPACPPCNLSKGGKFITEWRLWVAKMGRARQESPTMSGCDRSRFHTEGRELTL